MKLYICILLVRTINKLFIKIHTKCVIHSFNIWFNCSLTDATVESYFGTVWLNFLGVKAILTTKLEVKALKSKVKLFGKSYFYFKKC
jgi:hypothetical protein